MTNTRSGHVEVSDGASIYFEHIGTGERPLVVLFNAANQTVSAWQKYLPHLTPHVDVLAWDYRGQGVSTAPLADETFARYADDLRAVVDHLGLAPRPLRLLAVCFGCGVAAEFLVRHRELVDRAVLSGGVLTREDSYINLRRIDVAVYAAGRPDLIAASFFAHGFNGMFQRLLAASPEHHTALMQKLEATMNERARRAIEVQLRFLMEADSRGKEFAAVDVPIHVIAGAEDQVTPVFMQRRMAALFPRATYVEMPRLGHLLYVENPSGFFRDAVRLLVDGPAAE